MSGKILVAYASKTRATAEHASAIAGALRAAGREADLADLRETGKPSLDSYEAVIIGSGVRFGRWYGPARRLLKRRELSGKKVALFAVCGLLAQDPSRDEQAVSDYVTKVAAKSGVSAVAAKAFAGFMPDGTNLAGARGAKPVDTAASAEWGRELSALL